MSKQGKVWGQTEEIFNNGVISVNYLKIKKGGYCSEHFHRYKSNMFFVILGNLEVTIWRSEKQVDHTVVWPGEICVVEPGVFHQFKALTDVECLEIYETKLRGADIERRSTGGLLGESAIFKD